MYKYLQDPCMGAMLHIKEALFRKQDTCGVPRSSYYIFTYFGKLDFCNNGWSKRWT